MAVSFDRLPKYGLNEINVCAVVDRQIHIDTELSELKDALLSTTVNTDGHIQQFTAASDKMVEAVHTSYVGDRHDQWTAAAACSYMQEHSNADVIGSTQ